MPGVQAPSCEGGWPQTASLAADSGGVDAAVARAHVCLQDPGVPDVPSPTGGGKEGDNPGLCEHLQPLLLSAASVLAALGQRRCFTVAAALGQLTLTLSEKKSNSVKKS